MMKLFTFSILFGSLMSLMVGVSASASLRHDWEQFRIDHGRAYKSAKEACSRYRIFATNWKTIRKHNSNSSKSSKSYHMTINQFADLTTEEYRTFLGHKGHAYIEPTVLDFSDVPTDVDWRTRGAVTPVKNQQQCGSCWAFSTTGAIEGMHAIHTGKLVSLSEQELVDCASSEGNQGCSGGLMDDGFQFVIDNSGICSESSYPYRATDQSCNKTCKEVVTIKGYRDVMSNNETDLKVAVAKQPVSVAIEADQSGFQFYSEGVFDGTCGDHLDHGVLVVGYGYDAKLKKDYWWVKNSWGDSWGDKGYIRLVRSNSTNSSGQCGIAKQPSYPY